MIQTYRKSNRSMGNKKKGEKEEEKEEEGKKDTNEHLRHELQM